MQNVWSVSLAMYTNDGNRSLDSDPLLQLVVEDLPIRSLSRWSTSGGTFGGYTPGMCPGGGGAPPDVT